MALVKLANTVDGLEALAICPPAAVSLMTLTIRIVDEDQIVASRRYLQIDLDQTTSKISPIAISYQRISGE